MYKCKWGSTTRLTFSPKLNQIIHIDLCTEHAATLINTTVKYYAVTALPRPPY
jgi:hypothetical protein